MPPVLIAGVLAGVLLQGATSQPPAPQPPSGPPADSAYRVGPQDVLRITVFDEPSLSGSFRVDADGSISYPMLGRMEVAGRTVREIEADLTKALLEGYLRRPQVSVEIEQYRSRSIFIMGEVRNPGKYPLAGEVTLLEVLALAGSFTPTASREIVVLRSKDPAQGGQAPALPDDASTAEILRVDREDLQAGRATANLVLQDGDTIFVPVAERFYITGHVRTPGSYVLERGMTVQQAIAVAGGLTERGSNRGIRIRRLVDGKYREISVGLTDLVQPGDTIIVPQRLI